MSTQWSRSVFESQRMPGRLVIELNERHLKDGRPTLAKGVLRLEQELGIDDWDVGHGVDGELVEPQEGIPRAEVADCLTSSPRACLSFLSRTDSTSHLVKQHPPRPAAQRSIKVSSGSSIGLSLCSGERAPMKRHRDPDEGGRKVLWADDKPLIKVRSPALQSFEWTVSLVGASLTRSETSHKVSSPHTVLLAQPAARPARCFRPQPHRPALPPPPNRVLPRHRADSTTIHAASGPHLPARRIERLVRSRHPPHPRFHIPHATLPDLQSLHPPNVPAV